VGWLSVGWLFRDQQLLMMWVLVQGAATGCSLTGWQHCACCNLEFAQFCRVSVVAHAIAPVIVGRAMALLWLSHPCLHCDCSIIIYFYFSDGPGLSVVNPNLSGRSRFIGTVPL
jgi:hypothetical protein